MHAFFRTEVEHHSSLKYHWNMNVYQKIQFQRGNGNGPLHTRGYFSKSHFLGNLDNCGF